MSVVEHGTSAMVLPVPYMSVSGTSAAPEEEKDDPCSAGGRRGSLLTRQKEMRYDVRRIEPTESLKDTAARGAKPRVSSSRNAGSRTELTV
uniref:Uncharacterized protein n=1 Tax=Oryza sativa subsp. japonica TaxID=39947 RepID=Q8H5L2_ORYSJ|nr:hypothetical protein [Oryza sativa Japonica Group]